MPGINRRAIGSCLFLIGGMADDVVKFAVVSLRAKIKLANGVTHTIARIGGAIRVACVRRIRHPDAHELYRNRRRSKPKSFRLAFSIRYRTLRKRLPGSPGRGFDGIVASPVLNQIMPRVGFGPRDANRIHLLHLREIEHDPLRMQGVTLAGEVLGQIRIALPESVQISVIEARETYVIGAVVASESSARKRIAIGIAKCLCRSR